MEAILIALLCGFAAGWLVRSASVPDIERTGAAAVAAAAPAVAAPAAPAARQERSGPLQLTEYGKKIAAMLDADTWVQAKAGEFEKAVTDKQPFEIDRISRYVVVQDLGAEFEERMAEVVYQSGAERENITPILAVMLRNELIRRTGAQAGGTAPA